MATTSSILRGRKVTRSDVILAIRECQAEGLPRFLRRHGYRNSTRWSVRYDGQSFPSKAILGVAAGLDAHEFFGGVAETTRVLESLGFALRRRTLANRDADAGRMIELAKEVQRELGVEIVEKPWQLDPAPAAYYPSGSNRPANIRGLAAAGADVGCVVQELSAAAIDELVALAGTGTSVFVDSGAFSEVEWNDATDRFDVVRPIRAVMWDAILSTYEHLARHLGDQLMVVAPDRVGDQQLTLDLLARYRSRLERIAAFGARVLVPMQKGAISQVDFAQRVAAELRAIDWIPAMPCKKAATTPAEVAAFVRGFPCKHVHLLGVGVRNREAEAYAIAFAGTSVSFSMDSCWIAANAGKGRRLTRALDVAKRVAGESAGAVALAACFLGAI